MAAIYDKFLGKMREQEESVCGNKQSFNQDITGAFSIDFDGVSIRMFDVSEAVEGTLTISNLYFSKTENPETSDKVYTVETHIPASGDISTIIIPDYVQFIDPVEELLCMEGYDITYHCITARYMPSIDHGAIFKINYCYSYGVNLPEEAE